MLALAVQSSARADTLTALASVDASIVELTNTLGQPVTANVGAGNGSAAATAAPTSLSIFVLDTTHFSAGAPSAYAFSNFDFSIEGDGRDVVLAFTVKTLGSWERDELNNFAISGGFDAGLFSATTLSPLVRGNFVDVQFGSRLTHGSISQTADFYANQYTSYAWNGSAPGDFVLVSTFKTGPQNAGRFQFSAIGGVGNGEVDFNMDVSVSIFGGGAPGGGGAVGYADGIGDLVTSNGTRINILGAGPQGAVPEPAAWALMIMGFGGVGATLRRRQHPVQSERRDQFAR